MKFSLDFYNFIFKISSQIRFIGIYHHDHLDGQMKWGLESYMTKEETKKSLQNALRRWNERKELSSKLGSPVYTMTVYKLVKRATIELSDKTLILISTDIDADIEQIVKKLLGNKEKILEKLEIR
ncbi:hypothetical protein [Nitrosopumilus sp. b2]|uniref:Uncharacterized protein n=2 Tax=Nitrosopumilus piranensis TaxID=1582439 RepID=A0A0C5BWB1_9ARCH|nr:hypothetical protein [Nitrosopumilus sp. b2]AJM92551.1 hypothetical protein NPIRD3C_1339 [Nitrosopumilus piranensis]